MEDTSAIMLDAICDTMRSSLFWALSGDAMISRRLRNRERGAPIGWGIFALQ